jgi:hypothetical protein
MVTDVTFMEKHHMSPLLTEVKTRIASYTTKILATHPQKERELQKLIVEL